METTQKFQPKPCAECGKEFTPHSGNAKWCPDCVLKVCRRQTAERVRKYRARIMEHAKTQEAEGGEYHEA